MFIKLWKLLAGRIGQRGWDKEKIKEGYRLMAAQGSAVNNPKPLINEHEINSFEDVWVDVPTGAVAITIWGKATTNGMWFPLYIKQLATVEGFERTQFMLRYTGQILQSSDEL